MSKQDDGRSTTSDEVWNRLSEVLRADNLDQVAEKLGINPSTLRGRKARGAIPYGDIIGRLDSEQIAYVFKNEEVRVLGHPNAEGGDWHASTPEANSSDSPHRASLIVEYEDLLTSLMQRIETASLSKQVKIQIVDSLIRIVEKDIEKIDRTEN